MAVKLTTEPQHPISKEIKNGGIKKLWKGFIEAGSEERSKELVPGRYLDIAHL